MNTQVSNKCVHEVLEAHGLRNPESTAVQFEGTSLTYRQLHERSNRLARVLQKRGVGPEVRVGLYAERSLEIAVALLGIWKAGGAYVPIDPAHGSARMEHIANESGFSVLLTQKSLLGLLPPLTAKILLLDECGELCASESPESVISGAGPSNLAYMIYTSGSTGKPKGVQIEHRSVGNFLCCMRREPGFDASDTLLAVTTLAFDIAGLEIYLPLLAGGCVVIVSRETASNGSLLMQSIEKTQPTVMQATPATWRLLIESGWQGNPNLKVLVGGDVLSVELGRELVSRCRAVWNMYGPTETTIWSSIYRVDGREDRAVPIGRPIGNTDFYLLDRSRQPVCPGAEGELYIGGEGVARGYFERSDLTAEKFVPDGFSSRPGSRLYRTGDLARYGPDGNLYFLGRNDHQVKVRGFRVEPGEIESVLESHPAVRHSVVAARENTSGEKCLVAYFVADLTINVTPAQLRRHLLAKLPEYMAPGAFVQLAALPLTANGKVDRAALPAPSISDFQSDQDYVAPRNPVERKLVAIWEDVLGIRPIGIRTSFFDFGGNSLVAVRLFAKMQPVLGSDLPISTLFRAPTIEKLAKEQRRNAGDEPYPTLVPIKPSGSKPPFFCAHGGLGGTLYLGPLAAHLDPDRPFYGIESEGLDGAAMRRRTVEEMASYYLSEIRRIQPHGPYFLGGYCFGGIIAFEMAQQLLRMGEQAAVVAQLSTPLQFNGLEKQAPEPLHARFRRLLRRPVRVMKNRVFVLQYSVRTWAMMLVYALILRLGLRIPRKLRIIYVIRMLNRAEQDYVPKPYPKRLSIFYARDPHHTLPNMGWTGLASHIDNHIIGDTEVLSRRRIMVEPLVRQLAAELTICFDRAACECATQSQNDIRTGARSETSSDLMLTVENRRVTAYL
ncbi:MAG: amino acid adenylation domain-containing protein [Bryobacterales bacterium]|nr:amino acid adenylation domain-containing protein [Bryobacterales bacterium]